MEDQAKGEEINVTADAKLEEVDNFHAIDRKYIMPDVDKDMLPIISGEFYNDNHISFTMPILSYEFKHLCLRSYFSTPKIVKLSFLGGPNRPSKIKILFFSKAHQFIWPLSFPKPFFFLLYDYFKAVYDIFKI